MKKILFATIGLAVSIFAVVCVKMWNERDNIKRWNLWYDEKIKGK